MINAKLAVLATHSQKGVVLIVVLIMLVLISVIGIMVYKNSITDLRLATASQISQLLFQSNDAAFAKVEKEDRLKSGTASTSKGSLDSLQGYITRPEPEYVGAEVIFCVRPRSKDLFRSDLISEKNQAGAILTNVNNGFCDPTKSTDYVSEGRVMTQMTLIKTANLNAGPLSQEAESDASNDLQTTSGTSAPTCTYFNGYAVSILPSYSNASLGSSSSNDTTTVAGCLKQKIDTMGKCLTDLNVPHNIQVQTYKHEPTGVECLQ